jgi:ribokinase
LIDISILNEIEITEVSGQSDIVAGARAILTRGARRVIVTVGSRGAILVDLSAVEKIPAESVRVVDTAGAGDVFSGVLAAGLSQGLEICDAIRWAVRAATLSVTRRGTGASLPTAQELALLREAFRRPLA